MKPLGKYIERENDRRVDAAAWILWIDAVWALVPFALVLGGALIGNTGTLTVFAAHPLVIAFSLATIALVWLAGTLVARRNRIGAIIGLAIFALRLLGALARGHIFNLGVAWCIVAIGLIVSAWPLLNARRPVATTTATP